MTKKLHQNTYLVCEDDGKRMLTVNKRNENAIPISHPMAMTDLYHNYIVKPGTITGSKYTVLVPKVPKKPKVAKKNKRKSSNSVSSTVLTAGSRTGTSVNVDDIKTSSPLSANSEFQSANSVLGEMPPFKKGKTDKSVGKSDDISQVSATEGSTAPVSVHKVSPTREKARRKQQQCNLEIKKIAERNVELNLGIDVEVIKNYIKSLEETVSSEASDKSLRDEKNGSFYRYWNILCSN